MKVQEEGHSYRLAVYDGEGVQELIFMKREGEKFPLNRGNHPGTNCQEVIRALINRVQYLQRQIPCAENLIILNSLRTALFAFESRAARRHGRLLQTREEHIEIYKPCTICGHIECEHVQ